MTPKSQPKTTKRILAFLAPILMVLRQDLARKVNVLESRINKLVSSGKLCASLNHNHKYVTSIYTVRKYCNNFGFFKVKSGEEIVVFHVKRRISDVLAYLAQRIPWGITQIEAKEMLGRDCGKQLNKLVKQRRIRKVRFRGTLLYTHIQYKKAAQQVVERTTNPKHMIKPLKSPVKPPIFIEEIIGTFQQMLIAGQEQGLLNGKLSLSQTAVLLLMNLKDRTYRSVETLLHINERLRQACGIGDPRDILDHSTYCRYFNSDMLNEDALQEIITLLVKDLKKEGVIKGNIVAVDATHIFAWFNSYRPDEKKPEGAALGFHRGFFIGYKVHIIVDAHCELPLAVVITSGECGDYPQVIPLLEQLETRISLKEIMILLGDGAYFAPKKLEQVEDKIGGYMCAAINPRRSKILQKIKKRLEKIVASFGGKPPSVKAVLNKFPQKLLDEYGLKEGNNQESILKRIIIEIINLNLRLSVERVWSRLKQWTSFERPRTPVNKGVKRNVLWCIISMLTLALTAQRTGKEESIRSFSCLQ